MREVVPMVYLDDDMIKKYFETFIEAYGEAVKAANKPGQEPEFYKELPYKVDIFKMPNEAVIAIMYGKAPKAMYNTYNGDYDTILGYVQGKKHQHCMMFYPSKNFSTDDAKADAKAAVMKDTRSSVYRAGLVAARTHVEDIGKQLGEIAKANPWLEKQLQDLETKLKKAKAPLDKLWDEYKKIDETEAYTGQEMYLNELKAVDLSSTDVDPKDVEAYINAYIESYKGAVKPEYPEHAKPPFFKGAPFKVRATIMPNKSVAVLFKYNAIVDSMEVAEGKYDGVKALIDNKEYNHFKHYPPLKALVEKRASTEAKLAVKEDIRNTLHLALLKSTAKVIADHQEKVQEIMKTNPWLEGPLSSISNRLSGVAKLLEVLTGEIENNQLNKKTTDQKRLLQEVSRYGKPKATAAPEPEVPEPAPTPAVVEPEVPETPVVAKAAVVSTGEAATASSTGPVFMPAPEVSTETSTEPEMTGVQGYGQDVYAEQHYVAAAGMTEEEKAVLNDLRAEVFEFRKRVDEYERKLNYMDKYIEHEVQKRQDEKFKEQEEVYTSMIRKYSGVATGLGTAAIIISLVVLLTNIGGIIESLSSLFG
jgi:hypothetical protein